MSDSDNQEAQVDVPEEEEELDIFDAVQQVLKKAKHSDGLSIGVNEAARAIDRQDARLCLLADNCDNKDYKNLITALCAERGVKIFKVSNREVLGEWAGLCKYDLDGTARKTVKCSCVVVTNIDEETPAFKRVIDYTNEQNQFQVNIMGFLRKLIRRLREKGGLEEAEFQAVFMNDIRPLFEKQRHLKMLDQEC